MNTLSDLLFDICFNVLRPLDSKANIFDFGALSKVRLKRPRALSFLDTIEHQYLSFETTSIKICPDVRSVVSLGVTQKFRQPERFASGSKVGYYFPFLKCPPASTSRVLACGKPNKKWTQNCRHPRTFWRRIRCRFALRPKVGKFHHEPHILDFFSQRRSDP